MTKTSVIAIAAVAGVALLITGRALAYHVLPVGWTDEPARIAASLRLERGHRVAEIGAGDGALAIRMAAVVGESGQLFATELDDNKRRGIERRVGASGLKHITVIAAEANRTSLPDGCCDAVYMRMVFHHITDQAGFARQVARALRGRGRVVVIDFAPGALFFLGPNHGVRPDAVIEAFRAAGLQMVQRSDEWGGGTFALVFEAEQ